MMGYIDTFVKLLVESSQNSGESANMSERSERLSADTIGQFALGMAPICQKSPKNCFRMSDVNFHSKTYMQFPQLQKFGYQYYPWILPYG